MKVITEKSNIELVRQIFSSLSRLNLVVEEVRKIDEDKALPFLTSMFGKSLEVK